MTHVMALQTGSELVGDFKIERVLGAGGFGITYLADELALARKVTIKEYFPADFAARERGSRAVPRSDTCRGDYDWGLERFMGEAQTLARFDHRNIVRVYRYFRANNTGYMVLHFEEGRSLKAWLASLGRAPRQKELDDVLGPVLDALETVHAADYLHRDIAPDNIIIRTDGSPVLIDFGSARGDIARHSRTMSALVKPGYSPYEQYAEKGSRQGPWSDLYALAATIYFAITGKRPPDSPSRVVKDDMAPVSEAAIGAYRRGFLKALDRALALKIERRPQTVAEFRDELLSPEPQRRSWFADNRKTGAMPEAASAPASDNAAAARVISADAASAGMGAAGPAAVSPVIRPAVFRAPSPATERAVARAATLAEALAEVKVQHQAVGSDAAGYLQRLDQMESNDGLPRTKDVRDEVARNRQAARDGKASHQPSSWSWQRLTAGVMARASDVMSSLSPAPRSAGAAGGATAAANGAPAAAALLKQRSKPARVPAEKPAAGLGAKSAGGGGAKPASPPIHQSAPARSFGLLAWSKMPRIEIRRPVALPKRMRWQGLAIPLGIGALVAGGIVLLQARSPDASIPASASSGSRTAALIKEFVAHQGGVSGVSFANSEGWIVTAGGDGTVKVWNAGWGSLVRSIALANGPAIALAVEGTMALTGHSDGTTVLWDLTAGRQTASFRRNDATIRSVAFAAGATRIVVAAKDASVAVWDAAKSSAPLEVFDDHDGAVASVAASGDGRMIVSGGADRTARLFNVADLSLRRSYRGHDDPVTAVAISPNGSMLASGTADGSIRIWSTRTGRRLKMLRGHAGAVTGLAFGNDGRQLASSGADGAIKVWNPVRNQLVGTFGPSGGAVGAIDVSADGARILAAGADGRVRIWDARFK